jgi:DNA-directed RNA polymerase subunit alpha
LYKILHKINKFLNNATLEAGAVLEAELEVVKGVGYMTSDEVRKALTLPQDFIPVDALFSPVTKVNYTVENARVGQKTDYDKLILEVWTDGSISPKEAVETDYMKGAVGYGAVSKETVLESKK